MMTAFSFLGELSPQVWEAMTVKKSAEPVIFKNFQTTQKSTDRLTAEKTGGKIADISHPPSATSMLSSLHLSTCSCQWQYWGFAHKASLPWSPADIYHLKSCPKQQTITQTRWLPPHLCRRVGVWTFLIRGRFVVERAMHSKSFKLARGEEDYLRSSGGS